MQFRVLGPLEVIAERKPLRLNGDRPSAVLATMLLNPNRTVTVDQFSAALWQTPPSAPASNIRTHVAALRRAFSGAGEARSRLSTAPGGYRLIVHPGELDLMRFEDLVTAAGQSRARADHHAVVEILTPILSMWRGTPLQGLDCGPLLEAEVVRLEEGWLTATEWWADAALGIGAYDEVATHLSYLTRLYPLREQMWYRLMMSLYRSGRQADALAAYQDLYHRLDLELAVQPSRPMQELHRQILHSDPELEAFQAFPPGPQEEHVRPRQLPAVTRHFTGRGESMDLLNDLADGVHAPAHPHVPTGVLTIAVVAGTSGVGKTALAVHWAHQVARQFPDGQFFADLHGFDPVVSAADPADVMRGFLLALNVPASQVPVRLDDQSALWRSLLAGRRVLVVLDNARDPEQVRPLLPGAPGGMVVVTSRHQLIGLVAAEGAYPIELGALSDTEARGLLAARLGVGRLDAEPEATDEIIAGCAGLPIALVLAAALAATRPRTSLSALAKELTKESCEGVVRTRGRLDAFASDELRDKLFGTR